MKRVISISLLSIILLVSGFAFAAIDQPDPQCSCVNQSYGIDHSSPSYVFAGPKAGWLKVPGQEQTPALNENFR